MLLWVLWLFEEYSPILSQMLIMTEKTHKIFQEQAASFLHVTWIWIKLAAVRDLVDWTSALNHYAIENSCKQHTFLFEHWDLWPLTGLPAQFCQSSSKNLSIDHAWQNLKMFLWSPLKLCYAVLRCLVWSCWFRWRTCLSWQQFHSSHSEPLEKIFQLLGTEITSHTVYRKSFSWSTLKVNSYLFLYNKVATQQDLNSQSLQIHLVTVYSFITWHHFYSAT